MIFKRRDKAPMMNRLREALAPRKGIWRGMGYIGMRLRRLPDSPHRIALGFACGTMASFSPFFTLHLFVAMGYAWLVRGNLLSAAFGTALGNPITFPLIATASLQSGWWILGTAPMPLRDLSFGWLTDNLSEIFLPYLVGGLVPGLIASVVCYLVTLPLVAAYQSRRRRAIQRRAEARRRAVDEEQAAYTAHDGRSGDNA